MPGTRKRLSPAERRAVILRAASGVFAERGYAGAAMREVAAAAGITTPVLYDHFAAKDALYRAVVAHHAGELNRSWSDPPGDLSPERLVRHTLHLIFDWIEHNPVGWRLLFGPPPADPAVTEAHQQGQSDASKALTALLHRLPLPTTDGLPPGKTAEALAEATKWTLNAMATWWLRNPDLPRTQVESLTADLIWRGLHGLTT
ncbi:AcrR family transcriptional regulator [Crossiella equi]|uniref:AcrR family transcriptional regulator n=1 Tax=Crossiella equi TaxID=130796 RepID=A0ABS5ACA6_9PSEU|nr:TetR/AcrR family transcriptional regulator [Crossiella equi]MBP2474209.1 AcrR family transcriptional regulator [Crossiella equi]